MSVCTVAVAARLGGRYSVRSPRLARCPTVEATDAWRSSPKDASCLVFRPCQRLQRAAPMVVVSDGRRRLLGLVEGSDDEAAVLDATGCLRCHFDGGSWGSSSRAWHRRDGRRGRLRVSFRVGLARASATASRRRENTSAQQRCGAMRWSSHARRSYAADPTSRLSIRLDEAVERPSRRHGAAATAPGRRHP